MDSLPRRALGRAGRAVAGWSPGARRTRRASELLAPHLPEILVVDVGASYFPHERWQTLLRAPRCHWLLVDPNVESLGYVDHWGHPSTAEALCAGIAPTSGTYTLYETAVDTGSSLLKPALSTSMARRYGPAGQSYFFPVHESSVECVSLAEVLGRFPADMPVAVKLDTQGTELSILESVMSALRTRIVLVESEATLLAEPVYRDSGRYWEMQSLLEGVGYELAHMDVIYRRPSRGARHASQMPHECDAAFTLRPDVAASLSAAHRLCLLAAYIDYRLADEALLLLEDRDVLTVLGSDGPILRELLQPLSGIVED